MSFWSWARGAFGGGALSNPDKGNQQTGPEPRRTAANVVVQDERALGISAVFACVRILAQTGGTLPLPFYEKTKDGRNPLDKDHHVYKLLNTRPNNFMSAIEFRKAMWTQRVLWGNAYAKINRSGDRIVSLIPLQPEYMTVKRTKAGLEYCYSTTEGVKKYTQDSIFHIKGFSSDGVVGVSPLSYARECLGVSVAADTSAAKSIGGRANAVLELDDFPTDKQKEKLRKLYGAGQETDVYQSDGQLMITVGGMKYRGISIPPDDLQLLETRQFQVPEICRFFGVPSVMVDGSAGAQAAWPASFEQQVMSMLKFTLDPYLTEWEDKIPYSLLSAVERETIYAEHNVEGLLRADSAARAAYYTSGTQNGWLTRAEVRKKENLPFIEGSDELTVQVNMTNLEDLPKVNNHATE